MQTNEQIRIKSIDRFVNLYNIHNIGDGKMLYVGYNKPHDEYLTTTFVNTYGAHKEGFKYFSEMAKLEIESTPLIPLVTFAIFAIFDYELAVEKRPLAQFLCVESTFCKTRVWIATKHGHGQPFDLQKAKFDNNVEIQNIADLFQILNFKTCLN